MPVGVGVSAGPGVPVGAGSIAIWVVPMGAGVPVGICCPFEAEPMGGSPISVVDPGPPIETSPEKLGVLEPRAGSDGVAVPPIRSTVK